MEYKKYYLSSLDSYQFTEIRELEVLREIVIEPKSKEAWLVKVNPSVIGQNFGLGGEDINYLILTPRHKGENMHPLPKFPCFVHIARILSNHLPPVTETTMRSKELETIGWGEIYKRRPSHSPD
ncbi:MAG: hypothetical protein MI921_23875 [Cytophagales bacterium]|nr:hypothetical protein [Cytophagales bacterium]